MSAELKKFLSSDFILMHKLISFFICTIISFGISAQDFVDPGEKYANTITAEELKDNLSIIASDYFEGRETGTVGLVRAAEYISGQFKKAGIQPMEQLGSYYKDYPLIEYGWESPMMSDKKNVYAFMQDFYGYATSNNTVTINANEIIFLGYGIDDSIYSDYDKTDVAGKIILVAYGEPIQNGTSIFTKNETLSEWTTDWRKKVNAATEHKVKCILMVDPNFGKTVSNPQWVNFLTGNLLKLKSEYQHSSYCNNFFVSEQMAEAVLGKKKKSMIKSLSAINSTLQPSNFSFSSSFYINTVKSERVVYADNVLGFVEGSDLKDQVVVVSAHYDHLGKIGDTIYNGADDDGSGTVALIEMAEAMQQAKMDGAGPRRSVLFIAFSGEEKGLLGSKSYAEDPVIPFKNTVADLNIDMIGRIDEFHKEDSNYIYIIGSDFLSKELHAINESAAKTYTNLKLDYKYNSTTDPNRYYYRSDHYNFAKNNIPVIFYFSGSHADYHKPTDDIEKINFNLMTNRARLVFHTLWILANQDHRVSAEVTN